MNPVFAAQLLLTIDCAYMPQAAKLQQEAAAAIAESSAEDLRGYISPGHWRAMHLDISEAYTCPIVSVLP